MGSAAGRKLTRADYVLLPETVRHQDLLGGRLRMTPAPSVRHQEIVGRLFAAVGGFVSQQGLGRCWFAPVDVVLSETDVVQPDLLFVAHECLARVGERAIEGAPTLVVEVLSDSTRRQDQIDKLQLYDLAGVAEYWIVDPERSWARLFRRPAADQPFGPPAELTAASDAALTTPLLPGFDLPIRTLLL